MSRKRLAVTDAGEGPVVVFLHGLAGFKEIWERQVRLLAKTGFRAMALDLPGHGDSPMIQGETTISAVATEVESALDDLGVEEAAVVGHSMGGRVMFQLAVSCPSRVWALVAVGAQSEAPQGQYREALEDVRKAAAANGLRGFRDAFAAIDEIPRSVGTDPALAEWYWSHFERNRPQPLTSALDAILGMPRLTCRLAGITCPTLAIVGREDDAFLPFASHYDRLMQRCAAAVIDNCHHYPMLDAPEEFTRLLRAFLTEHARELRQEKRKKR